MPSNLWKKVLESVRTRVPEDSFSAWFKPLKFLRADGGSLVVQVPNPLFREWIEGNYEDLFQEVGQELGVADLTVNLVDGEGDDLVLTPAHPKGAKEKGHAPPKSSGPGDLKLNPNYRFETFVIGPSNRFAHAACVAVAQNPSKAYNPLYIYGGVGLGKTHLMQSIGQEFRAAFPGLKVSYISAERFMNEMISSIARRSQHEFRERYRLVDVLLLDDVQFLANKAGTQEELFHTFNALYESQKQIVISSDCPPRDLQSIEERLRSRFEWGLIADIQPPELETKVAILYKKAEAHGVKVPEDVALFIASRIKSNIRELEGCLLRLIAFSSFKGKPITLELAKSAFENVFKEEGRTVTVESIQKHVAASYKLKVQDLKSKTNEAQIVLPRQVAMYLCRELTDASLPEIGQKFGGKHHTTVLYSIRKVEQRMKKDGALQQQINSFTRSLR
jgi:chromosomal replication initiator protein